MVKINLREAENEQMELIRKYGLKRIVEHDFEHEKDETVLYRATTTVHLLAENAFNPEEPLATGVAYCSKKDNWHRRKGRVIATARALKEFAKGL